MLDIIRVHRNEALDAILDALFRAVADFARRSIPEDDMTAVLIRVQADPPRAAMPVLSQRYS
jgi:serine phosphatase RsbU (regulator of sigma subunit)